jgi:hypothetical protein
VYKKCLSFVLNLRFLLPKKTTKTRNAATMTESAFKSMIISALREKSRWWRPKLNCIKNARIRKGIYLCEQCGKHVTATKQGIYKTGKKAGKPKKIKNIIADHVSPVVDPKVGFVDWNTYIERMFIEEGWQAICDDCHTIKTNEEKAIAKERRGNDNT